MAEEQHERLLSEVEERQVRVLILCAHYFESESLFASLPLELICAIFREIPCPIRWQLSSCRYPDMFRVMDHGTTLMKIGRDGVWGTVMTDGTNYRKIPMVNSNCIVFAFLSPHHQLRSPLVAIPFMDSVGMFVF